jgi:hypothetical protein
MTSLGEKSEWKLPDGKMEEELTAEEAETSRDPSEMSPRLHDSTTREKERGKEGRKPKPAELKIGRYSLVLNTRLGIRYSVRKFFHQFMSVLSFNGSSDYLLGVQIAGVLKRKTFNLYHCMKKKDIEMRRASQEQIEFLMSVSAVPIGTHSVTFVPIADGLCFIADALYRYVRFPNEDPASFILKKRRSYAIVKHKITRRKPLPWNLQRSIKKEGSPHTKERTHKTIPFKATTRNYPNHRSNPILTLFRCAFRILHLHHTCFNPTLSLL